MDTKIPMHSVLQIIYGFGVFKQNVNDLLSMMAPKAGTMV